MKQSYFKTQSTRYLKNTRSKFDLTYSVRTDKHKKQHIVFGIKRHLLDHLIEKGHDHVDLLWDQETSEGEFVSHPTDGYALSGDSGSPSMRFQVPYKDNFGLPLVDQTVECQVIKAERRRIVFKINAHKSNGVASVSKAKRRR